jgi:protein TonB
MRGREAGKPGAAAMKATHAPLAWSIGISLALHAFALFAVKVQLAPALQERGAAPAILQAYLPPPSAPARAPATPPDVLKSTLDPPHAEVLKDPIKPKRRARAAAKASPREAPAAARQIAPPSTNELAAVPPETRGLDLRLPPPERSGTGLRAPSIARAERLSPEALRETLGRLSEEMLYPAEALQRGLEGEVVILVELGENGRILDASIASGSGHSILDDAAVRAVRKIGTLGPSSANKTILLPVRFKII